MKKNIVFIAMAAACLLAACTTESLSERESLDSRTVAELDVKYEVDGQLVEAVSYTHEYARPVIKVKLNNEGLRWNMESNRSWCKVVQEPHRGSGDLTLELEANESFTDRETATLTFTAGDFRGFRIKVDQTASSFIISQPYFIAGKDGGNFLVDITTPEGVDWEMESNVSWLSPVQVGSPVTASGETVTSFKLLTEPDDGVSRMGTVRLHAGAEKDFIRLWQFGASDFEWDGSSIILPAEGDESFSFNIPHGLLRDVTVSKFVSYSVRPENETLDKVVFSLERNLSDINERRAVAVSVKLTNADATVVVLPDLKQDYLPAGGLVSSDGLLAFAKQVSLGASTADWENEDGWVTMLGDIDMTGVSGWAGIGTPEHPFSGMFDGKGHSILNLKSSPSGIFNYCEGADESDVAMIQNIIVDESCSFYLNVEDWSDSLRLGSIVNYARNTSIAGCGNNAGILFYGTSSDKSPVWLGGILGQGVKGVSLKTCSLGPCRISISGSGTAAYVGGVAGDAQSIIGCSMGGTILNTSSFPDLYIGGITCILDGDNYVQSNSFKGTITLDGGSTNIRIGGLYAAMVKGSCSFDNATDMSVSRGTILVNNYKSDSGSTRVFAGGFLGYASPKTSLFWKGYEVQTDITIDFATARNAAYCCLGGILGGCDPSSAVDTLSLSDITTRGAIDYVFNSQKTGIKRAYYAGAVGLVKGPASFSYCTNGGQIGHLTPAEGSSNNGMSSCVGGIVGYADGGNLHLTGCKNQSVVTNMHYVNNIIHTRFWNGEDVGFQCVGGIVGAYNFNEEGGKISLTADSCENGDTFGAYRGFAGGIAGFAGNATFTLCTNKSAEFSNSNGFIQGGIAGLVVNASFTSCTSEGGVRAASGGNANDYGSNAGGIVGRVYGDNACSIKSCSFKGSVNALAGSGSDGVPRPRNGGGIVGFATTNTTVSHCSLGGTVQSIPVSEDNVADLAVGNKAVKPTDMKYMN